MSEQLSTQFPEQTTLHWFDEQKKLQIDVTDIKLISRDGRPSSNSYEYTNQEEFVGAGSW